MRHLWTAAALIGAIAILAPSLTETSAHGDLEVTVCDPPATSIGDNLGRGIVFMADRPFLSLEVRLGDIPGDYEVRADLRRSSGFVAPIIATSQVTAAIGADTVVHFDFDPVRVVGEETFSLALTQMSGPDNLFFGVGDTEEVCDKVYETVDNNVADPEIRRPNAWLRVLTDNSLRFLWSDTTCDSRADAIDVLTFLQGLAVPAARPAGGGCPLIGEATALDEFGDLIWGDWDCSEAIDGGDALPLLSALAGTDEPMAGCPRAGQPVSFAAQ